MEGIEVTSPANMNAEGALLGSERAAMLNEAIELVVEQIIDPLRKRSFAKKLMGTLVTDTKESSTILSKAADDIKNTFHAEFMHKIESEAVVEDLKKLERVLSEWEPKTEALMEANPANVTVDAGPDPYAAELNSQRQRLAALELKAQEFKASITKQRETISSLLGSISTTKESLEKRLEGTSDLASDFAQSAPRKWSDSLVPK